MTLPRPSRTGAFAAAGCLALAGVLSLPGAASAAGFAAPRVISGSDEVDGTLTAAIAPSGRTAVVYARRVKQGHRWSYQLRLLLGPSPSHLGAPTTLSIPGFSASSKGMASVDLHARPDGGFVLCAQHGCSVASPTGRFGPLVTLPGRTSGMAEVVRPDSSTVILRSYEHQLSTGYLSGTDLSSFVLSASGVLGPEHAIDRSADEQSYNVNVGSGGIAVGGDGTVAIAANLPVKPDDVDAGTKLGIRVMAPGADTFGPVVAVPGTPSDNNIELLSGPSVTVAYEDDTWSNDPERRDSYYVQLLSGGAFGPQLALPGATIGGVSGDLMSLPSGELFAVTSGGTYAEGDSDCFNPVSGVVAGGPLRPTPGATRPSRISTKGQISWLARGAALADGTVLAVWQDGVNAGGALRVSAAVRAAGAAAFGQPQRLPDLVAYDGRPTLVAAGTTAAIIWPAGLAHTSLVASSYRTSGPYAPQAALPKHPGTACDE